MCIHVYYNMNIKQFPYMWSYIKTLGSSNSKKNQETIRDILKGFSINQNDFPHSLLICWLAKVEE